MDLEKNIEIAAKLFSSTYFGIQKDFAETGYINGAKSQAAKDFWINSKEAEEYWKKKLL